MTNKVYPCYTFITFNTIVNSRPLVAEIINDVNSKVTLSPASLLTMKSKVIMLLPGRRLWRRVQHLSKEFWSRWRKEFLLSLHEKQKWSSTRRNFQQKDSVTLKNDNCGQNEWNIAKIIETFPDEKGFVRTVILLIGSFDRNGSMDNRIFAQAVDKAVLLVEFDKVE